MNLHAINSMARSRREDLLREAAAIRSAREARQAVHPVRSLAARAAHATGRLCFAIADAIGGDYAVRHP